MEQLVTYSKRDEIGVIAVNNPPVNALSSGVLEGIRAALGVLEREAEVRVMIMLGSGRTFVAGGDLKQIAEICAGRGGRMGGRPTFNATGEIGKEDGVG